MRLASERCAPHFIVAKPFRSTKPKLKSQTDNRKKSRIMIRVRLTSIIVNDQNRPRRFYTEKLGFIIKRDIPVGLANWLTIVSPAEPDGTEIALEPTFHSASQLYQEAPYGEGMPLTALAVDNIEEEYARLMKLGVVFQGEPKEMGPTTVAVFDDTCGNFIQLFQE